MLDDGQLTDSIGRTVDFRNCLVILTSNTGSRKLEDFGQGIGFESSTRERISDVGLLGKDQLAE